MQESLPLFDDESLLKPFDGTNKLLDYDFLQMCKTMENDVAITQRNNPSNLYKLLDRVNLSLGEEYGKHLEQKSVTMSGEVYPVLSTDKKEYCENKKQILHDVDLKFARITFAPVVIKNIPTYKVAFRLLPASESNVSHYIALLDDVEKLIFTEQLTEIIEPNRLMSILTYIARQADELGNSPKYNSLKKSDKTRSLNQLDEEGSAMIQPLIVRRTPFLINTRMYSKKRGITESALRGSFSNYRQPEKALEMRTIIAGRAEKVMHTPGQSQKTPISSELLIIENGNDRQKNLYRIPLDQIVSIQLL